jgi:hypothetical protein
MKHDFAQSVSMFTVEDVGVFEYFSGFSDSVWAISGDVYQAFSFAEADSMFGLREEYSHTIPNENLC